jgi:hypothetical protein
MSRDEHGIAAIRSLARQATARLRLVRAVRVAPRAISAALLLAVAVVACRKLGLVAEGPARAALGVLAGSLIVTVAVAWRWRVPEREGALALDRFHGLHDRLSSALAFGALPEPTPFMRAAMADALRVAPTVHPRAAVPLRVPPGIGAAAGLACLLAGVGLFEVRGHKPAVHAVTIEPVEMAPDDLDDVRDFLKRVKDQDVSDETRSAIEEFNRLVDDIANHRLDRTEAFRRMAALEDKLLTGSEADRKALEGELASIGEELKKSALLKPAGSALGSGNFDRARDELHDLARRARGHGAAIDKAKLEEMREALKAAAGDAERRREAIDKRRQELADEILKRKDKPASEGERSLLEKKQRELDRLDRDLGEQQNAERRLDRLDRELEQAAEDLMKDLGASADDLEQSAEELNSMDRGEASDKEKEELRQEIEELRQLVRQQGAQGQLQRLKRFVRMAHGQGGQSWSNDPNGGGGNGPNGQGQNGQGGDQQAQGGPGPNGRGGQSGQGDDGKGGETWILGPNGEKMLLLTRGSGSGQGGQESGSGAGSQRGRWGDGHDPNVSGKETNPNMGTEDSQVQGTDSAQGVSRSQVILGAAEKGFASRNYQRVYGEYHQVAEESLAKDDVPGGYRFYVKRYFELIRPRDDNGREP